MKNQKIPQKAAHYLIAAVILAAGILTSLWLLSHPLEDTAEPTTPESSGSGKETVTDVSNFPATKEPVTQTQQFAVRFLDFEGKLLEEKTVSAGEPAIPPELHHPDYVFKGWSSELYAVTSDMEVRPVGFPAGEEKNTFYADAVYAATGSRFCAVPVLSGAVDCSRFSLEVAYDRTLLTFDGAQPLAEGLTAENDETRGVVTLRFASDAPLDEPTRLAELYFVCGQQGDYRSNFPMAATEIRTIQNGEEVYTDGIAYETALHLFTKK